MLKLHEQYYLEVCRLNRQTGAEYLSGEQIGGLIASYVRACDLLANRAPGALRRDPVRSVAIRRLQGARRDADPILDWRDAYRATHWRRSIAALCLARARRALPSAPVRVELGHIALASKRALGVRCFSASDALALIADDSEVWFDALKSSKRYPMRSLWLSLDESHVCVQRL